MGDATPSPTTVTIQQDNMSLQITPEKIEWLELFHLVLKCGDVYHRKRKSAVFNWKKTQTS